LPWLGKAEAATRLTYSSTHIIGIGIRGNNPHENKCWLYYPEDDCPFYRCTVFSHYAEKNVPSPDTSLPTLRHGNASTKVTLASCLFSSFLISLSLDLSLSLDRLFLGRRLFSS
jgi:hypothetical protein